MLRLRNLGSGSSGNSTLVEARGLHRARRLLVDCGLGIRELEARLARAGVAPDELDAIFITHEHADHTGCVMAFARRHRITVWMSRGTFEGMGQPDFDGLLNLAADSQQVDLGEMCLTPFTVPHDAREPLQLTCSDGATRWGILTDLGHATAHVLEHLSGCDSLMLECNHDPQLLAQSSYPPFLKKRVGGRHGHLANADAAAILRAVAHEHLHTVVAAHLSLQNNRPDLARAALAEALDCLPADIVVADAVEGTGWLTA